MSSWFKSVGLDSAFESLSEKVQAVSESVQDAIPTEHKEFLAKITLNTDEMISERQNFGDEATRKAEARDRLSKILPWETLDAEREILVEECKDAILELSGKEETFFGPFEMPLLNVQLSEEEEEAEGEEHEEEPEVGEQNDIVHNGSDGKSNVGVAGEEQEGNKRGAPSDESREMLAKLEPLPPMLDNFDLDEHVGLIQRVLAEDPNLVEMQANISGGGARERTFWRNYFFHCAFTRYKCGLSIDEIWSYQEVLNITNNTETSSTEYGDPEVATNPVASNSEEEAIDFDGADVEDFKTTVDNTSDENVDSTGSNDTSLAAISLGSPTSGFEVVDDDIDEGTVDPELDELEAEILRELED
eukprot:jgi/Psemu1/300254/fgenesh1_kg.8_\